MTKATDQVTLVTVICTKDELGRGRGAIGEEQYRVIAGSNYRPTLPDVIASLHNHMHAFGEVTGTRV